MRRRRGDRMRRRRGDRMRRRRELTGDRMWRRRGDRMCVRQLMRRNLTGDRMSVRQVRRRNLTGDRMSVRQLRRRRAVSAGAQRCEVAYVQPQRGGRSDSDVDVPPRHGGAEHGGTEHVAGTFLPEDGTSRARARGGDEHAAGAVLRAVGGQQTLHELAVGSAAVGRLRAAEESPGSGHCEGRAGDRAIILAGNAMTWAGNAMNLAGPVRCPRVGLQEGGGGGVLRCGGRRRQRHVGFVPPLSATPPRVRSGGGGGSEAEDAAETMRSRPLAVGD